MIKNSNQRPNQMEMSIYTFTHDYYLLELPALDRAAFYNSFPLYRNKLNYKGEQIKLAPVVRIYGTNEFNQKCCCHVHGYFPFLYIKSDQFHASFSSPVSLLDFLSKLQFCYQTAFQTSKPIIYKAQLQSKFDFYGYHTQKQSFLKIYLFDPSYVTKLRELLNSRIISNKSFQCYQAHINYYMQFFSDFNIYGINQIKICGFTFRKNMKIMALFQKLSSKLTEGMVHRGWHLQELERTRPECFNSLHKTSCCYIEVDFDYQSILNAYQEPQSEEEEFHSSDEDILQRTEGMRKLKVTVTKALEQIWRDEKKRRSRFKIKKTLEGVIDQSKNIESTQEVAKGLKDPLWVNFMSKGQNGVEFINMVKSYAKAEDMKQVYAVEVDLQACINYQQILAEQREELVQKVQNRWKFYGNRKDKIIGQIMTGERGELPEWTDDKSDKSQSEISDEDSNNSNKSDNLSELGECLSQKLTKSVKNIEMGNTLKYRNNFKFELAAYKSNSLFSNCKFCRQKNINCTCIKCIKCAEEECICLIEEQEEIHTQQDKLEQQCSLQYQLIPPSLKVVQEVTIVQNQRPYYSKVQDLYQHYKIGNTVPANAKIAQYLEKQLKNTQFFNREPITIKNQKKLPYYYQIFQQNLPAQPHTSTFHLQYNLPAPTISQAMHFIKKKDSKQQFRPSSTNKFQDTFLADLVVFSYEILVQIPQRHLYAGNPQRHAIFALIFQIYNQNSPSTVIKGLIITEPYSSKLNGSLMLDEVIVVKDERSLFSMLISIVFRVDVDIFISWDMEKKGVRYLMQRGAANGINIVSCLSRTNDFEDVFEHINLIDFKTIKETYLTRAYLTHGNIIQEAVSKPSKDNTYFLNILNQKIKQRLNKKPILRKKFFFDMQLKGRVNINMTRLCQNELKLKSYTLEAVVNHLFQTQICQFTDAQLFNKFIKTPEAILDYMIKHIEYSRLITHELNVIGGIVQKSKVYGADFLSMMERGSQFKIQSIMCRTAKQNDYLTLSATKVQVANQSLLECRPLVIEPPKQFYTEPVLLFDFQSLYPSVMIAYNLCYSTCLGSIKELFKDGKVKKMGVSSQITMNLDRICQFLPLNQDQDELIRSLSNYIFITPNRVAFVRKNLKQGFIPKILLQFLISRIMIKNSTKLYNKQSIKKILKQRQLALKLFMNVMFGYTGASFSGRMPCSEIADSVVEVAKYCLRKSIDFLNSHPIYKGKVLYGDTDSIFFHLPNLRIEQTFEIGKKLADQITKMFPYPMEMKFEKVYQSLFLVSKKRYYGKFYESADTPAKYQGKGIETVRRDGISFTSNVMTAILNQLIDTKDLSMIKETLFDQSRKLLDGLIHQSQLCLAKQVKLLKYNSKHVPAHGQAAKRLQNIDPMLLPKYGQRLKYLVVQGQDAIKTRSIPLFQYMLHKERYHLDLMYYYKNLFLPPLRRILISLINLDEWGNINQFSKEQSQEIDINILHQKHRTKKHELICSQCLQEELNLIQQKCQSSLRVCRKCVSSEDINFDKCVEWNCQNLFVRKRVKQEWMFGKHKGDQLKLVKQLMNC